MPQTMKQCPYCGHSVPMVEGQRLCDGCWEIDRHLDSLADVFITEAGRRRLREACTLALAWVREGVEPKIDPASSRQEIRSGLPALASRIFALDGKSYPGCGFHWTKHKSIGFLLNKINDFDQRMSDDTLVVCELVYQELLEDVKKAEDSCDG